MKANLIVCQLTLEWAMLSKHVGDDKYRQLAEKSVRRIAQGVSIKHSFAIWRQRLYLLIAYATSRCVLLLDSYIQVLKHSTLGLPAQGINPAGGTPVGGYVVCNTRSFS